MNQPMFKIADRIIGGSEIFVIAEIGNNHNGSLELAKKLIDEAILAGADCVKFQIRNKAALYRTAPGEEGSEDLGVEYIQDLLAKVELTLEEHDELRQYCQSRQMIYLCTPWDEPSVDVLKAFEVPALKLASADLTNPYLIRKAASLGKPLILSTGMSFESEIIDATDLLNSLKIPFALLHCNSTYPCPEADVHLNYLKRLKEIHGLIGYSGHERGTAISLAAVALGAKIIERHITLDRSMEGPDHPASLEPAEFKSLVDGIRQLEDALPWSGSKRIPSQGELLNRENLGKSVIAATSIQKGDCFTESNLRIASPGQGLAPYHLKDLLGKPAIRTLRSGDFIYQSDLNHTASTTHSFQFYGFWGIPVRYHDFHEYNQKITPDLYEFHLSYRDLSLNPEKYLKTVACKRLVVHAPELFEDSELLDLAADDLNYRKRSIDNLKRVVEATETIRDFFPAADGALIVANVGGFSMDAPFEWAHRAELYERFQASCAAIDFASTELIPQNMAPFPWHFGGQRHQNIFMIPDEMVNIAEQFKLRYCIDLSHLQMTCTHFKLDFQKELAKLLPHTAHLHVADAQGVNGEGVLMGTGDINWKETWKKISAYPTASFIPEIWQGHKDQGAGFWSALQFISKLEEELS